MCVRHWLMIARRDKQNDATGSAPDGQQVRPARQAPDLHLRASTRHDLSPRSSELFPSPTHAVAARVASRPLALLRLSSPASLYVSPARTPRFDGTRLTFSSSCSSFPRPAQLASPVGPARASSTATSAA